MKTAPNKRPYICIPKKLIDLLAEQYELVNNFSHSHIFEQSYHFISFYLFMFKCFMKLLNFCYLTGTWTACRRSESLYKWRIYTSLLPRMGHHQIMQSKTEEKNYWFAFFPYKRPVINTFCFILDLRLGRIPTLGNKNRWPLWSFLVRKKQTWQNGSVLTILVEQKLKWGALLLSRWANDNYFMLGTFPITAYHN